MEDRNAVNAEYEVLESQTESTANKAMDISFNANVGTISYGDIENLPDYIRAYIKKLMPSCDSGVVPSDAVTAENLTEAKDIRADLNKLSKKLNAERIRIHDVWEKPYEDFKSQFDKKTALLDAAITSLGLQIKKIEDADKNRKRDSVIADIKKRATDYRVGFDKLLEEHEALWKRVWKDSYGNKTASDSKTQAEYTLNLLCIHDELKTIEKMPNSENILQAYYRLGDLSKAIQEVQRFRETQQREAEMKASQSQTPVPQTQPTATPPQTPPATPQIPQPEEGDIVKTFKVWHKSPKEFHDLIEYMKAHGFHACIVK